MTTYTEEQIEKMRQNLAEEAEWAILDLDDLLNICLNGCEGYNNWPDDEIIERHQDHFGEDETKEMMDEIL